MTPHSTILITGATSGIGAELAARFHGEGHRVIITGRRKSLLDQMVAQHPGMIAMVADVTDLLAIKDLAQSLRHDFPKLNCVILNAGIMTAEKLGKDQTPLNISEETVATNLLGPIRLTHALMPQLLEQDSATIVTVTSGLAYVPLAATPTYSATKAAIHSWTQSLRFQLEATNIRVHELAPPAVQTDLMPGHRKSAHAMPLDDFISEVMGLLAQDPMPKDVLVGRVKPFHGAKAAGNYDQMFETLNRNYRRLD